MRALAAAVSIIVLVCAGAGPAFGEEPGPVDFTGTSVTVTPRKPGTVTVVNTSGVETTFSVTAYAATPTGAPISLDVQPTTISLAAGKGGSIAVSSPSATVSGSGVLTVAAALDGTSVVETLPVVVTASPAIKPGVTSWKPESIWLGPVDVTDGRGIPLEVDGTCPTKLPGDRDGTAGAKGDDGNGEGADAPPTATRTAVATAATAVISTGSSSTTVEAHCVGDALELDFGPFPEAGTYKGTLAFGDDEVELEVRRAHHWLFAALLGFIGILVAVGQRFWFTNRLRFSEAKRAIATLKAAGTKAQTEFEEVGAGEPWSATTVVPAAGDAVRSLTDEVTAAQGTRSFLRPTATQDGEVELEVTLAKASKARASIDAWPSTGDAFKKLAAARAALDDATAAQAPGLVSWADTHLGGAVTVASLSDADALRTNLVAATEGLGFAKVVGELDRLLSQREPYATGGFDARTAAEARGRLREVERELERATVPSQVGEANVAADLKAVRRLVDRLPEPPPPPRNREIAAKFGGPVTLVPGWVDGLLSPGATARVADRVGAFLGSHWAMTAWTYVALVLAGLAALASGLQAQYVAKPWGLPFDYLTMFLWGYGATTLLTPIIEAAERLVQRPQLPAPPAAS